MEVKSESLKVGDSATLRNGDKTITIDLITRPFGSRPEAWTRICPENYAFIAFLDELERA